MKHYEILIMIHPDHSSEVDTIIENNQKMITSNEGVIHRLENWGRRKLAYSINKLQKAHYILINIECNNNVLELIQQNFRYNSIILRYLITKCKTAITNPSILMDE
jgi:small subunit ribosomal protein S6